ncbi:unnamed protein product, partial [Mesorhabditis spiculigera]
NASATQELSNWSVQDVKIVLFTGSDPRYFPAAGQNYTRKSATVGVAIEAFKSIDAQVLQLQHIARLVYDYVPSPNFSFAGGIYVLGQDGLVQSNMNTFYYDFSSFNRSLTALRSQLDENHATGDTIKDTIELINKLNFWDDTMLIFFTASSSDEILQAPMNDKYEMTYAWDLKMERNDRINPVDNISERLRATLAEQEKAVNIASTATGVIISLCFFVLPLVWSNCLRILPIQNSPPGAGDPWSEFTEL